MFSNFHSAGAWAVRSEFVANWRAHYRKGVKEIHQDHDLSRDLNSVKLDTLFPGTNRWMKYWTVRDWSEIELTKFGLRSWCRRIESTH